MENTDKAPLRFLGDYLFSESPSRLLLVGHLPEALIDQPAPGVQIYRLTCLADAERMSAADESDSPTVSGRQESGTPSPMSLVLQIDAQSVHSEQRLGRAVRAFPHRVMVHVQDTSDNSPLGDDVFFALGFRKLSVLPDSEHPEFSARWYEYRLSHYKSAPDWLNARFWANPERFDLDDDYEDADDEE